ncbi:MAG: M28 family peptidase, partial [Myxococcota bacterium]|nr:M28 family peptidase [Myxococcota bacterium]
MTLPTSPRTPRHGQPAMLLFLLFLTGLVSGCPGPDDDGPADPDLAPLDPAVLEQASAERMRDTMEYLASDALGGRIPGSYGHALAREAIREQMVEIGLEPLGLAGDYSYPFPMSPRANRYQLEEDGSIVPHNGTEGVDLVGLLPGSDPRFADEYLVLVAHYDHLGVSAEGEVYNGAFDDASGVVVGLEIARLLSMEGASPPRSIIFLFSDAEEFGLVGAEAWLEKPTVPVEDIVAAFSADPLGRPLLPDYAPILHLGLEKSPAFLHRMRDTTVLTDSPVIFIHRDVVPVFASDQDTFYRADPPIPAGWFVNPGFAFYHEPTDRPETIDYRVMLDDVRYLAQTLFALGHDQERYAFEGSPPIGAETARDLMVLFEGVLASEYPTA